MFKNLLRELKSLKIKIKRYIFIRSIKKYIKNKKRYENKNK